jgi:hypothetical protein
LAATVLEQHKRLKESSRTPWMPILLGALAVAAAGGGLLYLQQAGQDDSEAVLTDAARDYLPKLDLNNVNMEAREDALGQTLLEITGEITNLGESEVTVVEANCVFRNVNGLEIGRQRSALVSERTGNLPPGDTQNFRLAFDSVPADWNQVVPDLFIAQIHFSE